MTCPFDATLKVWGSVSIISGEATCIIEYQGTAMKETLKSGSHLRSVINDDMVQFTTT